MLPHYLVTCHNSPANEIRIGRAQNLACCIKSFVGPEPAGHVGEESAEVPGELDADVGRFVDVKGEGGDEAG